MLFFSLYVVFFYVLIYNKVINVLFSFAGAKRRQRSKLAIFSKTLKRKPGTKEEKLRNDIMKPYLRDHGKIQKTWLVFNEAKKNEVKRKFRTLWRFFKKLTVRPNWKDWPRM